MPRRLLAVLLALLAWPAVASASHGQLAIFQDPALTGSDPSPLLAQFRALGANTVRVLVNWYQLSPEPASPRMPLGFDPADPGSYSPSAWLPYDRIVLAAEHDGITVDFTLTGGAPRWAEAAGIPPQGFDPYYAWKPSARLFGAFARAVGERYSGTYTPTGAAAPLPAVRFWALWNEPNFGQDLAPQAIDGSRLSYAPARYRTLVDAGWSALQGTGHGADTILIGELAAQGDSGPVTRRHPQGLPGYYSQTRPEQFLRSLYCVDAAYRTLRGGAARVQGCPATAAGSRQFRAQHPGLFAASGVSDHPYPGNRPPVLARRTDPDFALFPQLPSFERSLDRLQSVYGSRRRLAVYNTEFGYITRPPQGAGYASPAVAAADLNWTEYLSWRSPRIASYMQYLLEDPAPRAGAMGFASGLETSVGQPKATFFAYRMPLFLPRTELRRGRPAEVWGAARPAAFMALDSGVPQTVAIELQRGGRGPFATVRDVGTAGSPAYFDVRVLLPASGKVRLAYTYPVADPFLPAADAGATIYSRQVAVSVR